MGWTTEETEFDSWQKQEFFLFCIVPRSVLGPPQPPHIQWISMELSSELNRPGYEFDRSIPSSVEVKNV
jgi:hypothetical protein